ncbi:formylglycine-generating enzyme family protein [Carboxylicivirga sp. N1Y90]|uniref:formylglycine-generating enzyme family protein n=1 Tax=Carboxylicivirga fragile TaxID=3417571 RepID=UPI003D3389B7|nr:formylglycine-generating enzyme family protein [Marinilabiliaceae bacterium N1Y90]
MNQFVGAKRSTAWKQILFIILLVSGYYIWYKHQGKSANHFATYTEQFDGISFKMIAVDGGTFSMGSNTGGEAEHPLHEVKLNNYYLCETVVTQALWKTVMGSNPSFFKGDSLPVESVSLEMTQAFVLRLNELTGEHYRLPTEAEWEFAAQGGNLSSSYKYSGSDSLNTVGWYGKNSGRKTHAVKQKLANELGFYDLSGNVWEWCSDWYGKDYYNDSPIQNPSGPSGGTFRVVRGGSWYFGADYCRITYRGSSNPESNSGNIGFRLANNWKNEVDKVKE